MKLLANPVLVMNISSVFLDPNSLAVLLWVTFGLGVQGKAPSLP